MRGKTGEGLCPETHALAVLHLGVYKFPGPCLLSTEVPFSPGNLGDLECEATNFVPLSGRLGRTQFCRGREVNQQLGTAEGSLSWPACHTKHWAS